MRFSPVSGWPRSLDSEVIHPSRMPAGPHPSAGTAEWEPPPAMVAHYAVEQRLGAGAQGEVFAAWDTLLLRPVALKRLRRTVAHGEDAHVLEARRSAGLTHSAFVRIHGVVNERSGQWIVMERVFGRELNTVVEASPLTFPQATSLIIQAAQALAEVHDTGVAHGDIKPSNLMVQSDGQLRILDFGIAHGREAPDPLMTHPEPSARPAFGAGTLAYMAPERLLGALPSPCADLYALGAVFLEAIGGRRPASGGAFNAATLLGGSDAWWFPPDLPWPLLQLIRAMGARDPTHRPPDMSTIVRWLETPTSMNPAIAASRRRHQPEGSSVMTVPIGVALMLSLMVGVMAGSHSR